LSKNILFTGAQGFIGSRLLPLVKKLDWDIFSPEIDLFDITSFENVLKEKSWDAVIHLAAISHIPTCEKNPELATRTNVLGTENVLAAIQNFSPDSYFVFASTAQVYSAPFGDEITAGVNIDEPRVIAPQNHYAHTKRQAEITIEKAADSKKIKATILRIFNHTHHTQSADFFVPHLFSQIKDKLKEGGDTVSAGNMDLYRDIGSLHDLLNAFCAVLEKPPSQFEIFNICSGHTKHLSKIAHEMALALKWNGKFTIDPSRIRPGDPKLIRGSHDKLTAATGWRPSCETEKELIQAFFQD